VTLVLTLVVGVVKKTQCCFFWQILWCKARDNLISRCYEK